jgi:hypothetical protein
MTLDGREFLRRFLLHAVPSGFMRIRHFGLLANRVRAENLAACRRLLSPPPSPVDVLPTLLVALSLIAAPLPGATDHACCPACGRGRLIPGPHLSPLELSRATIRLDSS